jgi:hypothetical protein
MIVPLIAPTIAETPMVSNKVLRAILQPYAKPYSLTDNVLQNARTEARKLIFGVSSENAGYASFLREELEKAGHFMLLSFTTRKETIKNVKKIIIADEIRRRKEKNLDGLPPMERPKFVQEWKKRHEGLYLTNLV